MYRRSTRRAVAAALDRAVYAALCFQGDPTPDRRLVAAIGAKERIEALHTLRSFYGAKRFREDPNTFFAPPPPAAFEVRRVRAFGPEGGVYDVEWRSHVDVFAPSIADTLRRFERNSRGLARVYMHRHGPRPAILLVHGYLTGRFVFEERFWPVASLFAAGYDVAIAVLPFHGARGEILRGPIMPSSDPRVTIEGFRQTIHDLRTLMQFFEAKGAPAVGAMGMSLGGYIVALLATIEPRLAFAVPYLPLSSIAGFARDAGSFIGSPGEREEQHALLEEVYAVASPLARTPRVAPEGRLVIGGEGDRMVPAKHAVAIARHFDAPLEWMRGGHFLQFDRGRGFRAVLSMLDRLGLVKS